MPVSSVVLYNDDMFLRLYAIALPIFVAIDAVWLGLAAKSFYSAHLGFLMKERIDWIAAAAFYLLFIAGIVVFVLTPALEKHSPAHALTYGALFGLVTYATYDLTNQATVRNWPLIVTAVDLAWGAALSAMVSVLSYIAAKRLGV